MTYLIFGTVFMYFLFYDLHKIWSVMNGASLHPVGPEAHQEPSGDNDRWTQTRPDRCILPSNLDTRPYNCFSLATPFLRRGPCLVFKLNWWLASCVEKNNSQKRSRLPLPHPSHPRPAVGRNCTHQTPHVNLTIRSQLTDGLFVCWVFCRRISGFSLVI